MTIVTLSAPAEFGLTERHGFDPKLRHSHTRLLAVYYAMYAELQQLILTRKDELPGAISRATKRVRSGSFTIKHWFIGDGQQTMPATAEQRDEIGAGAPYSQYFIRDDGELVFALTTEEGGTATEVTQYVRDEDLGSEELRRMIKIMHEFCVRFQ